VADQAMGLESWIPGGACDFLHFPVDGHFLMTVSPYFAVPFLYRSMMASISFFLNGIHVEWPLFETLILIVLSSEVFYDEVNIILGPAPRESFASHAFSLETSCCL
jgi:hypothetical protein